MQQNFVAFDFQQFIQRRLKLGRVHYLTLLTLALVEVNDGIQAITISLITPILKQSLNLDENQVSFLTSIFFIGVGGGALIAGIQSNKYGRKKALLFGTLMQLISALLLAYHSSYTWLCVCRLLYGFGFGSTLAVAPVIITELMPINIRGRSLLVLSFINSIGKLGGVGLAFIFIEGQQKQISGYMISSAILSLLAVFLVYFSVKQSFRFLLFKKNHEQACKIINQIIIQNDPNAYQLTVVEQNSILNWSSNTFPAKNMNLSSIQLLSSCKRITILLSISWFCNNFIFFGEMFIVPFMLSAKSTGLLQYFWMTLGQIPSFLLTFTLIEKQGWGRKTSLTRFFLATGLLCLLTIWFLNSTTLFFTKMLMKAIFQMLSPFTSESYPTSARSIGVAFNSCFGRIGSTLMPFIIYPLYNQYANSPFLLFSLLCLFGAMSINSIKKDTLNMPLDGIDNEPPSSGKDIAFKELNEQKGQQIQLKSNSDPSTD